MDGEEKRGEEKQDESTKPWCDPDRFPVLNAIVANLVYDTDAESAGSMLRPSRKVQSSLVPRWQHLAFAASRPRHENDLEPEHAATVSAMPNAENSICGTRGLRGRIWWCYIIGDIGHCGDFWPPREGLGILYSVY